jgi:DNA-binding beta-propeller fold protein YncE
LRPYQNRNRFTTNQAFFRKLFGLILFLLIGANLSFSQNQSVAAKPAFQIRFVKEISNTAYSRQKTTFLHKLKNTIIGQDETAILKRPFALLAYHPDSILILDQEAQALFKIEPEKINFPKSLRSDFSSFTSLVGLCKAADGSILFTDSHLKTIYRIPPDLKKIGLLNDSLQLSQPTGIAFSKQKNEIWVVETTAHQIRILDENGVTRKIVGNRGIGQGEFNFPTNIWIDAFGMAYVIDAMNFRIQLFDPDGNFISMFGEAGDASGYLSRPKGIAVDSYGNIYVTDALFHAVQVFDQKGIFLYQFGNQGRKEGEFWMPAGIFIDSNNRIYIADSFNARIQVFQLVSGQE